jgi:hypothetical protein
MMAHHHCFKTAWWCVCYLGIIMHEGWEMMVDHFTASSDMMESPQMSDLWHRQWQTLTLCHGDLSGCCWALLDSSGVLKGGQMMCVVSVIPQQQHCHGRSIQICVVCGCGEKHISTWRCAIPTFKN